jgi:hypothetical protein
VLVLHHRNFWAVTGDRECWAPANQGDQQMKISEKYRLKALDCEKRGREAKEYEAKCAWADVAIEWHCLANRTAQESSLDRELEPS